MDVDKVVPPVVGTGMTNLAISIVLTLLTLAGMAGLGALVIMLAAIRSEDE